MLCFTYVLILFTDFVEDPSAQYPLGYLLITLVIFAFVFNISYNIWCVYQKSWSKYRQMINKKEFLKNMANKDAKLSAHVQDYKELRSDQRSSSSSSYGPASMSSLSESSMSSQKNYLSMIREEPDQEDLTTHRNITVPGPTPPVPIVIKPDPIVEQPIEEETPEQAPE